jgi:hypothetical protein
VKRSSLFLYWTLFHYIFRPKWPSSGVEVVVVQESAAHCNTIFFLLLLLPPVIFGYVGCTWLLFCNVWCTVFELFKGIYVYSVIVYMMLLTVLFG